MATLALPMRQRGTSMIEVLVTIVILMIGLLGLAGLQSRLQTSEMESYQRAQALILLEDMASRIAANRADAASYVTTAAAPLGTGVDCSALASATTGEIDRKEWCEALLGAAERADDSADAAKVGVMVGGRGCVEDLGSGNYMVTVAWQGMAPISAPPDSVACGADLYDGGADSTCVDDLCRRTVTTLVSIPAL